MSAHEPRKSIIVFGGNGGIGNAVVELFEAKGWSVFATFNTQKPDTANNTSTEWLHCDVTKEESVRETYTHAGTVSVVVNATASPLLLKPVHELTIEDYYNEVLLYTMGTITTTKLALPNMSPEGGLIVHLLTEAIQTYPTRMSSYITGKSGAFGFIQAAAQELERSKITLLGILPSFVETKMLDAFPPKLLELERNAQPTGTFLNPQDIANVIHALVYKEIHLTDGNILPLPNKEAVHSLLSNTDKH